MNDIKRDFWWYVRRWFALMGWTGFLGVLYGTIILFYLIDEILVFISAGFIFALIMGIFPISAILYWTRNLSYKVLFSASFVFCLIFPIILSFLIIFLEYLSWRYLGIFFRNDFVSNIVFIAPLIGFISLCVYLRLKHSEYFIKNTT